MFYKIISVCGEIGRRATLRMSCLNGMGVRVPSGAHKKRLSEADLSVSVFADRYGNQNPTWSLMTDRVDHCICKQMHGCQGNPLSG